MTPIQRVAFAMSEHARKNGVVRSWEDYAKAAIAAMLLEAKESFATDAQYASLWLQSALDEEL